MATRYRLGLITGLIALLVFPLSNSLASPTGHEVAPEFRGFYEQSGGLPVFGYALAEPAQEDSRLVQYFERQRLELHPEHAGTPYEVLLGHVGRQDAERRGLLDHDAFQPRSSGTNTSTSEFFPQTGHTLSNGFRDYWYSHGLNFGDPGVSFRESLALFGFPISEEFVDPETGLVTQYFERARFEFHPEHAGTEHAVLLGHLGNAEFQRANGRGPEGNGPPGQPAPKPDEPENDNSPSTTIQDLVDKASPGDTVRVPAGVYRETVIVNKPITLIGEPGAEIRGDDKNGKLVREYWVVGEASNVTIDGFTMRYANTPTQHGAINNNGYDNWTIRNCDLAYAKGANVSFQQGSNHRLENCDIHHGGQLGVHGWNAQNVQVRNNRIWGNNTDGHSAAWEAGGLKFANLRDVVLDGNTVFDNDGPGLWCDIDCDRVTFSNNRVHHNQNAGIQYELSFNGRIVDNVVYENGHGYPEWGWGAGILSQNSSDVEISRNLVAWNADGISVISQDRGSAKWNNVTGNYVHRNTIITVAHQRQNVMALAWLQDWSGQMSAESSNNRGEQNRYFHLNPRDAGWPHGYVDQWFPYEDIEGFNKTRGEHNARLLSASEKDQILRGASVATSPERR